MNNWSSLWRSCTDIRQHYISCWIHLWCTIRHVEDKAIWHIISWDMGCTCSYDVVVCTHSMNWKQLQYFSHAITKQAIPFFDQAIPLLLTLYLGIRERKEIWCATIEKRIKKRWNNNCQKWQITITRKLLEV